MNKNIKVTYDGLVRFSISHDVAAMMLKNNLSDNQMVYMYAEGNCGEIKSEIDLNWARDMCLDIYLTIGTIADFTELQEMADFTAEYKTLQDQINKGVLDYDRLGMWVKKHKLDCEYNEEDGNFVYIDSAKVYITSVRQVDSIGDVNLAVESNAFETPCFCFEWFKPFSQLAILNMMYKKGMKRYAAA